MIEPGVKGEAEATEHGEAFAKILVAQETAWRAIRRVADRCVGIPSGDVADAAKAITAGADVRGEPPPPPPPPHGTPPAPHTRPTPGLSPQARPPPPPRPRS